MAKNQKTLESVVAELRVLIRTAHAAAAAFNPNSDEYAALSDLINQASASSQLIQTYEEAHNGRS